MFSFSFFVLKLSYLLSLVASKQVCLDDNGNEVDWYFVYKINNGLSYAYFDNGSGIGLKTDKSHTLDENSNSCVERTLNQVYNNKKSINYIGYNDEDPTGSKHDSYGHTKGVLAFDDVNSFKSGFWLIHSIPKFPDFNYNSYMYNTSDTYGQSFLCITINNINYINTISNQLLYYKPYVYSYNSLNPSNNNSFNRIISKKWLSGTSIKKFNTSLGFEMIDFTRSGDVNIDIMENIISPYYCMNFIWETWMRDPSEDSYCPPQYTWMELNNYKVEWSDGTTFKETQDHSKIGVSYNPNSKYKHKKHSKQNKHKNKKCSNEFLEVACIGGLNRMTSQNSRGGGYVCFTHSNLWNSLSSAFVNVSYCN